MYVVNRTTILSSIVVVLLLFGYFQTTLGQYDQLTIVQDNPQPQVPQATGGSPSITSTTNLQQQQQQATTSRQPQQEIFVQPNSRVKIECKLPQIDANGSRKFYWNFQRSSHQDNKPDLLCYQTQCIDETAHGIQLEVDQSSGAYDLLIGNATYELNDGIYYCDYKDTSPESRATINREFRLTVLIPPQPPTISALSLAPAREGQEHQLNCVSFGGNPEPNITWFRNEQPVLASLANVRIEQVRQNGSTTSTLTWIPTIDDHQATYKCSVANKAMNGLAPFERELTLPVEYAPRITVGPFNPLRVLQGDKTTISCDVNANPPAKGIRWLVDGHLISNHFNHTIHEVKISDAGLYSCQADNGILPPAALLLNSNGGVAANTGSGSSGNLFSSFFGLSSSSSSTDSNGNPKTAVEARLQLEVLYQPRVQVRQSRSMPLNEGDHFSLNCSVESWPPAHEFIWTKQEYDLNRRISSSASPMLEFQSITASDMGNYTCTAVNRLEPSGSSVSFDRQSSASSLVVIRHKPGFAEILVGQNGETELGNKTQIQCRAKPPGFPEPHYKFWKYSGAQQANKLYLKQAQQHGPVYTFFSAKAEDEAKYGCMASNELGVSNEADGELIVNEVPNIISDSARRPEDARPPGDSPYSITVRATGKPEPKVTWFHRSPIDGRRVALNSGEMMSRFRIETVSKPTEHQQHGSASSRSRYTVVSTLTFKSPLQVDDRGLYSVEFNNGLSRSAIEDFQLRIYHPPVPVPRQQPVLVRKDARGNVIATHLKAGFNPGETAHLTCRVSAYPKPEMVWYGNSGRQLDNNSRYRTEQNNTIDDIWESTISFTMSSEDDYSEYLCVTANSDPMTNTISENVRIFTNLSRKSLPDAPSQLEQVEASQDSVTIQWLPGFDGGFVQNHYIVQLALEDQDNGSPLSERRISTSISEDLPMQDSNSIKADQQGSRLFNCYSANPCTIPNLAPKQTYLMRVKAQNELGDSRFSDEIRVHTRANLSQIPQILDATFDPASNMLYFNIEPNPEYLLNNLIAKIDYKSLVSNSLASNSIKTNDQQQQQQQDLVLDSEWRPYTSVPIRQERVEVNLSNLQLQQQARVEQFRLILCSRSNDQLCGSEFVVSSRGATSSFLQDQRGLSLSIVALMSIVILIALVGSFATSVHSCCLSRKAKKAAALDRADGRHHLSSNGNVGANNQLDNKSSLGHTNGGLVNGNGSHKGSHGSTITTSNDSSTNNLTNGGAGQQMDLMHGHLGGNLTASGGSSSDHSNDHSRQAKLDSLLPPNYNHYADRASLMLEQQQQQAAYMQSKLSSPFGLPTSVNGATNASLMNSLSNSQSGGHSPMSMATNQFAYNQHQLSSLEQHQQNSMMFGDHVHDQTNNGISMNSMLSDPANAQSLADGHWPAHQFTDDYNNYNTLAGYHAQVQPQPPTATATSADDMLDPTYGTSASLAAAAANASGLMMGQQSAAYDNNANNQFSQYVSAFNNQQHDSSQYQQEIAAAQQQMYGTLTRNSAFNHDEQQQHQQQQQSIMDQQQQQDSMLNSNDQQQQYMSTNGLIQPPPPAVVESDYGTTRSSRLIREIIV